MTRESLLKFLERASTGVKGLVTTLSGEPLSYVIIGVKNMSGGQDGGWAGKNVTSSGRGEFWRILLPGSYTLTAWQPCLRGETQSLEVDIKNEQVKLTNFVFKSKLCWNVFTSVQASIAWFTHTFQYKLEQIRYDSRDIFIIRRHLTMIDSAAVTKPNQWQVSD